MLRAVEFSARRAKLSENKTIVGAVDSLPVPPPPLDFINLSCF